MASLQKEMQKIISFILRFIPRKVIQLFGNFGLPVIALFYSGNKVECAVCHKTYKKFLPYGRLEASRKNALCPNCLSLERHRLIWLFLQTQKPEFFEKKHHFLHVAPELCFIKRFEKIHGDNYITADIESPLAKVKMDVHDIPFPDNTFDIVFCNHVLEHVDSDVNVLKEFYRVMKPGAWAIFQSPIDHNLETTKEDPTITDPKEREKEFGQDDHVRMYGKDYNKRLELGGFKVNAVDMRAVLGEEKFNRFTLPMNEKVYLCVK